MLSDVMYFTGEHVCKSPIPFDATTFDLRIEKLMPAFRGELSITITPEEAGSQANRSGIEIAVIIDQSGPHALDQAGVKPTPEIQVLLFCYFMLYYF